MQISQVTNLKLSHQIVDVQEVDLVTEVVDATEVLSGTEGDTLGLVLDLLAEEETIVAETAGTAMTATIATTEEGEMTVDVTPATVAKKAEAQRAPKERKKTITRMTLKPQTPSIATPNRARAEASERRFAIV